MQTKAKQFKHYIAKQAAGFHISQVIVTWHNTSDANATTALSSRIQAVLIVLKLQTKKKFKEAKTHFQIS